MRCQFFQDPQIQIPRKSLELMTLPELLFTGAGIIFAIASFPTLIEQFRLKSSTIPLSTSFPTFMGLLAVVSAHALLEFWVPFTIGSITTATWFALVLQRVVYR